MFDSYEWAPTIARGLVATCETLVNLGKFVSDRQKVKRLESEITPHFINAVSAVSNMAGQDTDNQPVLAKIGNIEYIQHMSIVSLDSNSKATISVQTDTDDKNLNTMRVPVQIKHIRNPDILLIDMCKAYVKSVGFHNMKFALYKHPDVISAAEAALICTILEKNGSHSALKSFRDAINSKIDGELLFRYRKALHNKKFHYLLITQAGVNDDTK